MKPSLLFRRLRFYLVDRRLAATWLSEARAAMQRGERARALLCLRKYREVKTLAAAALQRLSSTVLNMQCGFLPLAAAR